MKQDMHCIIRVILKGLLLFSFFIVCLHCPDWADAKTALQENSIWLNASEEFMDITTSPLHGTLEGYVLTVGFTAALMAGLHNDLNWFNDIQDNRSEWQDKVMVPTTLLGDGLFHVGAYAALYKLGNDYDKKVAAQAIEGQINVAVVSALVKLSFSATRPDTNNRERLWFQGGLSDSSFASGHTMTAFCAAAIIGDAYNIEWITYPLAALVGYSRIYNYRHWPTDVIGGAGLGILIGYTVIAFHETRSNEEPGIHFSLEPISDGAQARLAWHF